MLRARRDGLFDIAVINMYGAGAKRVQDREVSLKLWQWGSDRLEALPQRCLPIICGDMNVRLGSIRAAGAAGSTLIGDHGAEQEGPASRAFREWCCQHNLEVLNTTRKEGSGKTWSGGAAKRSRIDYILLPADAEVGIVRLRIQYEDAFCLQLARCLSWIDHAPVQLEIMYRLWWDEEEKASAEKLSRHEAGVLRRSEELQTQLQEKVEVEMEAEVEVKV